jgi:hypothetical protein
VLKWYISSICAPRSVAQNSRECLIPFRDKSAQFLPAEHRLILISLSVPFEGLSQKRRVLMGQFRYLLFAESRRTFADRDRKGCDQSLRVEFLCCHSLDLPKQGNGGQRSNMRPYRSVSLLPPGHDAWVVGDEPLVVIDISGMADYEKQPNNKSLRA